MQRSRKAFLQRRVVFCGIGILSKKHLYFKAFLLFLSWGALFSLNSMNCGGGFRDVLGTVVDESNRLAAPSESIYDSNSDDALSMIEANSNHDIQRDPTSASNDLRMTLEDHLGDEIGSNGPSSPGKEPTAKETPVFNVNTDMLTPSQKNGRISRVAPPGLDEFKNKALTLKERSSASHSSTIVHRVEPSGIEYNYASAAKGAKVLAFNKEAKGASNILDKDKDKYLRNPCSVEEKYVVIELSEETLVDSLEIVNFEHYSSNLKGFELLSSSIYPTDSWAKLGNFTAQNVKHSQRFVLPEPKWARYLKLNLLSHYGSEFYCTLSVVEVYGVDAVERMLEDLISVDNKRLEPEEQSLDRNSTPEPNDVDDMYSELLTEIDYESKNESPKTKPEASKTKPEASKTKPEASKTSVIDTVENKPSQVGRMPGDTVLKILMQKVQSFDVNFSILERYLEELNSRYGHIFKELDDDIAKKDLLLENIRSEIEGLQKSRDDSANQIQDHISWKFAVSTQLDQLVKESSVLRSEMEMLRNHQNDVENRGLVVIFICFIFGCIATSNLFINLLIFVCRIHDSEKLCTTSSAWTVLLLVCSVIIFILVI